MIKREREKSIIPCSCNKTIEKLNTALGSLPGLSETKQIAAHPADGTPIVFMYGGTTKLNFAVHGL